MRLPYKIFGIGLSKTGTTSLTHALEMLDVRAVHYPKDDRTIEQLTQADFNLDLFEHVDAVTDTPVVPYYKDFDRLFPGSRFILTVRPLETWLDSVEAQWSKGDPRKLVPHQKFNRLTVYQTYRFDRVHYADVYRRHVEDVRRYFDKSSYGRLLEMAITCGDGWELLCPFLEKPIPDRPFPHVNRRNRPLRKL